MSSISCVILRKKSNNCGKGNVRAYGASDIYICIYIYVYRFVIQQNTVVKNIFQE